MTIIILSQIGILFWCISVSLCLFCSVIIDREKSLLKKVAVFLRFFGLVTLVLLLDDLFLLHESIFPKLLKTSEEFIYLCYLVAILVGLFKFKTIVLHTQWLILLLSFIFFSFSLVIDFIPLFSFSVGLRILLEDGCKLFGIVNWFCYFGLVCLKFTRSLIYSENKLN
jgi:hypothetical protein